MASQMIRPAPHLSDSTSSPPVQTCWNVATRIAFRFFFVYFVLLCIDIVSVLISISTYFLTGKLHMEWLSLLWRGIVPWFGRHVLLLHQPIAAGHGDNIFDWTQLVFLLLFAAVVTAIWSVLDRKRTNYAKLYEWLRVVVRLSLAGALIVYGVDKIYPLQFGAVTLSRLATRVGNLDPESMLWMFMAASTGYTIFSGLGELIGAVLLIVPRTANVGAVVTIGVMANVFALNVFYDVPVKIYAANYLLMGLFLLAPELPRLTDVLLFNRATEAAVRPALFRSRRANRWSWMMQLLLGAFFLGINLYAARGNYVKRVQASAMRPPLYGIWAVNDFSAAGNPPALSGEKRWQQLIFDRPGVVSIESADGENHGFRLKLDSKQNTLVIVGPGKLPFHANLHFEQPQPPILVLDGTINGNPMHAVLHRIDETKFPLTNTGLHWIQ
ncbi:MAG: hypothetical protein WA708_06990 [Acidobacteriaceae bacterium]